MFDQVKMSKQGLIDFFKLPERENIDHFPKKTESEFYKMLLEKTSIEEKKISSNPGDDNKNLSQKKLGETENYHDERFSNNIIKNNPEENLRETKDLKPASIKEVAKKEASDKKKTDSETDNITGFINQLYSENNLKKFIEVIKSALSGDNKGVNDNFQKLFSGLKQKTGKDILLSNNAGKKIYDNVQKSFAEQLKIFGREFKEFVSGELLKFTGNRKSVKTNIKMGEKDLNDIALTILDNLKKNKSREVLKHEVKVASDEIKPDKKQVLMTEFPLKKVFVSDEASSEKNSGGDKNSGRDGYSNSGNRTDFLNRNRFDRPLAVTKAMDFRENLQDIIDKAKISVRDSRNGTFTVRLNPRELGSVNVNLIMENGVITGKFLVDNEDVKSHLLSNLTELKFQLEESGISVGEFSVNVNDQRGKYLKQNDENNNLPVPVLNSEKDLLVAADQYSSNTVMHNGYINMVI